MDERDVYIMYLTVCILALIINIIAILILLKKKSLKSFEVLLSNILSLNVAYSLNEIPAVIIFMTSQFHNLLKNKTYLNFRYVTSALILHGICFFIVYLTLQRLVAVKCPLRYANFTARPKTIRGSLFIYFTIALAFIICILLMSETSIDGEMIDRALRWLFIIESVFIVSCYTMIIYGINSRNVKPSVRTQERRRFKAAIIVSISFLISYVPVSVVVILQDCSHHILQFTMMMIWIDSFVNPFLVILNVYRWGNIFGSVKEYIKRTSISESAAQVTIKEEIM